MLETPTAAEIEFMLETPELFDDGSLAVFLGDEWPELPEDPTSQERLLEDANRARDRLLSKKTKADDPIPADAWSVPSYVEPDRSPTAQSTREYRTTMAKQMKDNVPCSYCSLLFPVEVLDECASCRMPYCYDCIGDGQLCVTCRPVMGWLG